MDKHAKIVEILSRLADRPVDPSFNESLFESGLIDSFSLPVLVLELENTFAIRVPDSDLSPRKFDTIARIQTYVESRC